MCYSLPFSGEGVGQLGRELRASSGLGGRVLTAARRVDVLGGRASKQASGLGYMNCRAGSVSLLEGRRCGACQGPTVP